MRCEGRVFFEIGEPRGALIFDCGLGGGLRFSPQAPEYGPEFTLLVWGRRVAGNF